MSSDEIVRTFVVAASADRVWQAFVDPGERAKWYAPEFAIELEPGGAVRWAIPPWPAVEGVVEDVEPGVRLRTTEGASMLPGDTTVTVTFEAAGRGTRVTITHAGFGTGEAWGDHLAAHGLGWSQSIADLVLYLERGIVADRFFTTWRTSLGVAVAEIPGGLEVVGVQPSGYADNAGIEAGDVLLRIGGVPVYTRADLWSVQFAHETGAVLTAEFARGSVRMEGKAALQPLG
jgi:uncharacterized protein YndB with AHSA1/START domain